MRGILRVLVPVVLVLSIILNAFMYLRWNRKRPVLTVNGQTIRQKDVDDYLELDKGPAVKAVLVRRLLLDQEAKKQNVVPAEAEINEEFALQKERNASYAQQISVNPWKETEAKNQIREQLEQIRLRAKDVKVTDQEIQEEYGMFPTKYDTPNKARCEVVLFKGIPDKATGNAIAPHFNDIQELLKKTPPVAPVTIMRTYPGEVIFWGDNNIFTFYQELGTQKNALIFNMKPGEVKEVPPPQDILRQGILKMLVKMDKIEPGHKADVNDPKTRDKIRLVLANAHAKSFEEYLNDIWSKADFQSEDPQDKSYIEHILLPGRAGAAQ